MADGNSNDNDALGVARSRPEPDAHGQAAMLLVESLLHGLVERSLLSRAEAIEIVAIATEVKHEVAAELGDSPQTMRRSLALLEAITATLSMDQIDR